MEIFLSPFMIMVRMIRQSVGQFMFSEGLECAGNLLQNCLTHMQ